MNILQRYYLYALLRSFTLICVGLGSIITLTTSFKLSAKLSGGDPSVLTMIAYSLLGAPRNIVYIMPISALVATLLTIGQASGARELVAVTAAGGRLKKLFAPMVIMGVLLSMLSFALGEFAVPAATRKAEDIRATVLGLKHKAKVAAGATWLRAQDGSIARLGFYSKEDSAYRDISVFRINQSKLDEVMRARKGEFDESDGTWALSNITVHSFARGLVNTTDKADYPYLPKPSEFASTQNFHKRMSAFELMRHLDKLSKSGFRNPELNIEMHSRFAEPLINLMMILLGVGIAARRSLGALKAASIGLMVTALYWLLISMCNALGIAGVLHHVAAAWLTPVFMTGASIWLFFQIPE